MKPEHKTKPFANFDIPVAVIFLQCGIDSLLLLTITSERSSDIKR